MGFLQVGDLVHHYISKGDPAQPTIVFANSLGSDWRIWHEVTERLANDYHIVCYDKRGHGLSEAGEPPYSVNELAHDVYGLLDGLKVERMIVCGISVGGLIAQAMALARPERVRGLILCDTGARIGTAESWQQRIDMVEHQGLSPLTSVTMERWFSERFREKHPVDVRGYRNMLLQTSINGYIGTCAALRDADFRADVSRVKQPTLVLCGAIDMATPPALGEELAGLIPGAKFSLIAGAAHLPCVEQPERMAERIRHFLQEVELG